MFLFYWYNYDAKIVISKRLFKSNKKNKTATNTLFMTVLMINWRTYLYNTCFTALIILVGLGNDASIKVGAYGSGTSAAVTLLRWEHLNNQRLLFVL